MIEMIAFDADDTLWHSENFYHDTQAEFTRLLAVYQPDAEACLATLHQRELKNLPEFGYGVKGFAFSMVEAAIEISQEAISGHEVQKILDLAHKMLSHEIRLLDHVSSTLQTLAEHYPLMMITKGDLVDQERKAALSGLLPLFQEMEIVSDKTTEIYARLLKKHALRAEHFLMVGNSMRSDILPVLELGGYAAYVPYPLTWAHEVVAEPSADSGRFFALDHLGQLPELVEKLNAYQ